AANGFSFCTASSTGRSVRRLMNPLILSLEARESFGGGESGEYFPVSTPWPKGDHTICEMPLAALIGITFFSGNRHNSEYCGWLETKCSTPVIWIASSICLGDHSEKPIQRTLPLCLARVSASIVSASGVFTS